MFDHAVRPGVVLLALLATTGATHAAPRTEVLFSFGGDDGALPSDLTADATGTLYGTTQYGGGSKPCPQGCGVVFHLVPPVTEGGGWTYEVLYRFAGMADGARPSDRPILDPAGNLYGTAPQGGNAPYTNHPYGNNGDGVVWELSPPPTQGGSWTYQVLHTFAQQSGASVADGIAPFGRLARDSAGVLYGTTHNGGSAPHQAGIAYALSPPAAALPAATTAVATWTETVLHDFDGTDGQGGEPLTLTGHQTQLWGLGHTLYSHRQSSSDLLFDIRLGSQTAVFGRRDYNDTFIAGVGGPILDGSHDVIFGAYLVGGLLSGGDVVELSPPATPGGAWSQTNLHVFDNTSGQGFYPNTPLLRGGNGSLYGTTMQSGNGGGAADGSKGTGGVVFRLDPPAPGGSTWAYTELHQFDGNPGTGTSRPDGFNPVGGLVFGRNHELYGTTQQGGRHRSGTIYMQTLR